MKHLRNPLYRMWVRRKLVKLQGGACCYCRRQFTKRGPTRATIEHKKARMDGGTDDLNNLAAACFHCNQHRGQQKNSARQKAQRENSS
ncbi:HNH endonuclease [Mesorhizobium sp. L-8-10]|uniref:HNH endonuclease n=1 Tax=Mesorhizobium sp. L-8-10 TaxID=2744523 RepID=UPI00313C910C